MIIAEVFSKAVAPNPPTARMINNAFAIGENFSNFEG